MTTERKAEAVSVGMKCETCAEDALVKFRQSLGGRIFSSGRPVTVAEVEAVLGALPAAVATYDNGRRSVPLCSKHLAMRYYFDVQDSDAKKKAR